MDFIYAPLIILLGFVFIKRFRKQVSKDEFSILKKLWVFHLLVAVGYYFFTRNGGGDAWGYWLHPKLLSWEDFIQFVINEKGTRFLYALNYLPTNVLGMGYFSNTLLFSLFGFIGFTYFFLIARETIPYNFKLGKFWVFPLIFFLPNLHFWSSGIGKDTLLFLSIGMFTYALLNIYKRIFLIIISLTLAFFIRPHMVLFILLSFGLAYVIDSDLGPLKRLFLGSVLILGSIIILPAVLEFVKVEEITTESVEKFSEDKSALLSRESTGSRLGPSASFPIKLFAFYFRPFFYDVQNLPGLIASFENFILLVLGIKVIRRKPYLAFKKAPFVIKGFIIFMLIGSIAFSLSLGNVGIMIRMRNMFLPGFIIFMLWVFSYALERKFKAKKTLI